MSRTVAALKRSDRLVLGRHATAGVGSKRVPAISKLGREGGNDQGLLSSSGGAKAAMGPEEVGRAAPWQ